MLVGVLTRRDLLDPRIGGGRELREILFRPPKFVYDDCTARQAANHMVNHNIGRLPVVLRSQPTRLVGIVTRSDILSAYRRRIEENEAQRPDIRVRRLSEKMRGAPLAAVPLSGREFTQGEVEAPPSRLQPGVDETTASDH